MPPLRVPGDGLLLSGSPGESESFPSQAFAITLSDDVIGDLVRCAQNGDGIELSLGSSPVSRPPCLIPFSILAWENVFEELQRATGPFMVQCGQWELRTRQVQQTAPASPSPASRRDALAPVNIEVSLSLIQHRAIIHCPIGPWLTQTIYDMGVYHRSVD